jgi:disulfide bond formation protein DsbB
MTNSFIPPEWACRMGMRVTPRLLWWTLAIGGASLAVGSIFLTEWLNLHPCHLSILQRLLFIILALLGGHCRYASSFGTVRLR